MSKKIKIGLIFGGKSGEHEVSLVSARSIFNALDKKKYDVALIGIDKSGNWRFGDPKNFWINPEDPKRVMLNLRSSKIVAYNDSGKIVLADIKKGKKITRIDVFFPITHGTFGEDGCLQGHLESLGAAYVGSNVLGSAVGMDKDIMKRLFSHGGILIGKFHTIKKSDFDAKNVNRIIKNLGFPIFVKPANLGSSVGISKASNRNELRKAIKIAFYYDNKIVLEECIEGREIECSVLGNEDPVASVPGEIRLSRGFYSYEAKYIDGNTATPIPKADLAKKKIKEIQKMAIRVFKLLDCEGMGRVDFFLDKDGKLYVNEINTLPGFTSISMYPKMFEHSGLPYPRLLDELIQLGIKRKKRDGKLKRIY